MRRAWSVISFFGAFMAGGAVLSLAVTQGFALFASSCALCSPSSGVTLGALAGLVTGVMQWTDRRREARGR